MVTTFRDTQLASSSLITLPHEKGLAVSSQAYLIYLPQVDDGDCQQQEQRNDSQKDDPPGNFGIIFKLSLQENSHLYLRMACSQDSGGHVWSRNILEEGDVRVVEWQG